MKPLLEIQTTPARYEYEISNARLVKSDKPAERQVNRAAGNMRRQTGRVEMNSARRKSDMNIVDRTRSDGQTVEGTGSATAGVSGTGDYTGIGSQLAGATNQSQQMTTVADSMWGQTMQHSKGDLVLVPVSPVELHYIPASMAMDYQTGELNANWNIGLAKLDFIPGSFRLNFTEFASISITYLGGPNYVPPSAAPDFEVQA